MSVLIKGMELPTRCSSCPMLEGYGGMDGLCHAANKWLDDDEYWTWYVYPDGDMDDSKPSNCPLIPIPPHGDLIDRDALGVISWHEDEVDDSFDAGVLFVLDLVDALPTIIGAEEDE